MLGISLAAVFAVTMIFTPAFATGHPTTFADKAGKTTMKKDGLEVVWKMSGNIPLDGTSCIFGVAAIDSSAPRFDALILVTHGNPSGDSTNFDTPSNFHPHVLNLTSHAACDGISMANRLAIDLPTIKDSQYTFSVKDNEYKIKGVPLAHLGGDKPDTLVAFNIVISSGQLCVVQTDGPALSELKNDH